MEPKVWFNAPVSVRWYLNSLTGHGPIAKACRCQFHRLVSRAFNLSHNPIPCEVKCDCKDLIVTSPLQGALPGQESASPLLYYIGDVECVVYQTILLSRNCGILMIFDAGKHSRGLNLDGATRVGSTARRVWAQCIQLHPPCNLNSHRVTDRCDCDVDEP